ncbi:hypothetical protein ONZ45_g17860 [Pleurotus djamor]|nr:hypothetical protein ONZ45_g17860 [Pleurotus djamor]
MILEDSKSSYLGSSSPSLVLEDVFDIKAASLDTSTSLFDDDDPSLRTFPINNGLFDDDRMETVWKPKDEFAYSGDLVVLNTSYPPLNVLLGRTIEDCFRDFPSPKDYPSPLTDSSSSTPDSSPWCEHWHPLPKQDPDPVIDTVLDEINLKMHIFDTVPSPSDQTPLLRNDSSLPVEQGGISGLDVTEGTYDHRDAVDSASRDLIQPTPQEGAESIIQHQPQPPPRLPSAPKAKARAGLRPCRSSMMVIETVPSPDTSPSSADLTDDADVEEAVDAPHCHRQPRSRASTPTDASTSDVGLAEIVSVPPPAPTPTPTPSPPVTRRTSPRRRFVEDDEPTGDSMSVDPQPPKKRARISPSRSTTSSASGSASTSTSKAPAPPKKPKISTGGAATRTKGRFVCPEPWCGSTFSRRGDVKRHVKNAAAHVTSLAQLDERARCSKCGENLSRADARKRHELKGSCGKRTIRQRGIVMPRIPQASASGGPGV